MVIKISKNKRKGYIDKCQPVYIVYTGPRFDAFGECSNPCKHNDELETVLNIAPGTRVSTCRWNETGPCVDRTESCHGSREWVFQGSGESDVENCIIVGA